MPPKIQESGYFEQVYQGPYQGIHSFYPEMLIGENESPDASNVILKNAEIRTRPRMSLGILGTPDGYPIDVVDTFLDGNNVSHTVIVTRRGLWQLNPNFAKNRRRAWNSVGTFPTQPGPDLPVAHATFLNKFYSDKRR